MLAKEQIKLVAFGDSLTAGALVGKEDNYVAMLEKSTGLSIVNSGVPGNTTEQALKRLNKDVLLHNPDLVIVQFGMNDSVLDGPSRPKVSIEKYYQNLLTIITEIKKNGAIPILMTIHPIIEGDTSYYYYNRHDPKFYLPYGGVNNLISLYNDAIYDLAEDTQTIVIDIAKGFNDAIRSGQSLEQLLVSLKNSTTADGVHPTKLGHTIYAEKTLEVLNEMLYKPLDNTSNL